MINNPQVTEYEWQRKPMIFRCSFVFITVFLLAATCSLSLPLTQVSDNRKGVIIGARAYSHKWYTFTSPDGDFRLAFPQKPSPQAISDGPVTIIRSFEATMKDGMTFSINFQDMGGDPQSRENNEWERRLEELLTTADRQRGLRVVQIHRLKKNVVEAEIWQTIPEAGANVNYLRRSILRRGRIYTLACGSVINGRTVDKPVCQRFFNSFRFMTKPRRAPYK